MYLVRCVPKYHARCQETLTAKRMTCLGGRGPCMALPRRRWRFGVPNNVASLLRFVSRAAAIRQFDTHRLAVCVNREEKISSCSLHSLAAKLPWSICLYVSSLWCACFPVHCIQPFSGSPSSSYMPVCSAIGFRMSQSFFLASHGVLHIYSKTTCRSAHLISHRRAAVSYMLSCYLAVKASRISSSQPHWPERTLSSQRERCRRRGDAKGRVASENIT